MLRALQQCKSLFIILGVMAERIEERLPSHWASALINDDWTGLEEEECEGLQSFIANELNGLNCVDVEGDSSFQLAPSYWPWLLAGHYSTFIFVEA